MYLLFVFCLWLLSKIAASVKLINSVKYDLTVINIKRKQQKHKKHKKWGKVVNNVTYYYNIVLYCRPTQYNSSITVVGCRTLIIHCGSNIYLSQLLITVVY